MICGTETVARSELDAAQRFLLAGGVSLILVGLLSGGLFALLVSHTLNAELRSVWASLIESVAHGGTTDILPAIEHLREIAVDRGRAMSLHSHIAAYGLLAAMIALAQRSVPGNERQGLLAAAFILTGGMLQAAGMYTQSWRAAYALSISDCGTVLLEIGIGLTLIRLLRSSAATTHAPQQRVNSFSADPGLLRAGAALVCIGLLLGMYVAWRHIYFEQPALVSAFTEMMRALEAGDVRTASAQFNLYKTIQTRIDITAGAHSHAVFFGLVLVVTAFAIRSLTLSRVFINTARMLAVVGAFLLPMCVFLAPRISMRFAIGANVGGALVVAALAIVLIGLLIQKKRLNEPDGGTVIPVCRPLVLGALATLLLGFAASLLWSHLGAETPRLVQREDVAGLLAGVSTRSDSAVPAAAHVRVNLAHSRMVNAHAHFLNLGVLVLALALLLAGGRLGEHAQLRGAVVLAFGVPAYLAGLILDGVGVSSAGHVLAFAGAVSTVAVAVVAFWNLLGEETS